MAVAGSERRRPGERMIAVPITPYDDEYCGRCPKATFRHAAGLVCFAAHCEEWDAPLAIEGAPRMAQRLPECVRGQRDYDEALRIRPDRPPRRA
jgi:hypothetical protein